MVFKSIEVGQKFYTVSEAMNVNTHVCEQTYNLTRNSIGPVRVVASGTLCWFQHDVYDKIEDAHGYCENTRKILREMLDCMKEQQVAVEAAEGNP